MSGLVVDDAQLGRAAEVAVDCLGTGAGERVLVIAGSAQQDIATRFAAAAAARGANPTEERFDAAEDHVEPPAALAAAMREADVCVAFTDVSLSHTAARRAATEAGTRVATAPGIDTEMFARAVDVDYEVLKRDGVRLAELLTGADTVHIASDAGTDLTLSIAGRDGRSDDGDMRTAAAFGNFPAGEGYVAPLETGANGVLVVDGSLLEHGVLAEPVELRIRDGRIEAASGVVGAELLRTLDAAGPGGRLVAELGIGTNPAARITGEILEDEKVRGTVHVAFGSSAGIGGENDVPVHVDGVIRKPTLRIGEVVAIAAGELFPEGE
ncbi:MAG: aminopeptidase [Actinobacteria bacterium]|nr:aminopeptidase [Actinomycetota bacterium]